MIQKYSIPLLAALLVAGCAGDPNGPGLPTWLRGDKSSVSRHRDNPVTAGPDTTRARYEFLMHGLPPQKY